MDVDSFIESFENMDPIVITSSNHLASEIGKQKDILANAKNDWEKRTDALKKLRAIIMGGGRDFDEIPEILNSLTMAFEVSVKDLRSQVSFHVATTISLIGCCLAAQPCKLPAPGSVF